MSTIVVGFDGSSESRDALHLASAMAHSMDAKLVVATAVDPPLHLDTWEAARFAAVFDQARVELPDRDFAMRELKGVSAPAGLSDVAAVEGAELIVIGSTHRSKLGRVFPGSAGERLLSRAPCAVAIAPRGFAAGKHFGVGLVGVAFDGSHESEIGLRWGAALARRLDSRLRVITIVPNLGPGATHTLSAVVHDHASDVRARALAELPPSLEVETALEDGDPAHALARHGVDLDLLVIGSRGRGALRRTILGGVSADVMRTAPCPVLAVPRTADPMPNEALEGV